MFGTLFAIALLVIWGEFGGVLWWLFVFAVAFATAWVWARLMWPVFKQTYGIEETINVTKHDA